MTAEADFSFGASLAASMDGLAAQVGGLCDRMDKQQRFLQRANEAFRRAPIVINVPLVAGAATLNPTTIGPDIGYYWSVRKLAGVGWTAGTVNTYVDNTGGEPIAPFTQAGVFTFGKGEQMLHPNSSIAITAAGITGTVQLWGWADQFETWLLPWYVGTNW